MSKKLKNDELKNVSGGCGGNKAKTSEAPSKYKCSKGHEFTYKEAYLDNGKICCPQCGEFIQDDLDGVPDQYLK